MTITAIGFANKFYTLWYITEESKPLGNGCNYVTVHHTYVKNISFDKATALAKYPDAILDETLHGQYRSFDSFKTVWDNVDTFRFGKYQYMKIDTNTDTSYIAWYWDQVYDEHKAFVGEVLKSRGYEIRKWDSGSEYLMSPEDLEAEKVREASMASTMAVLNRNEPFEITFDHNPSCYGNCRIEDVLYHFQQVHENYYQGYDYYLPVLNGKQKRIKNKPLIIKDYTFRKEDNGLVTVEILDFEICK